ncbi:MAG: sugar ABC transporter permease [Clostridiales bacterium]|jgi:multiple sugar transport system permease protein|nr:sugar ABC transporter permease [Clostridiales bacterium]
MESESGATGILKNGRLLRRAQYVFRRDISAWVLMLPSLLIFVFFIWAPLISGIHLSFFQTKGFDLVRFIGLQNYIDVISESSFKSAVANTFKYVLWSLLLGFPLPILVGVMLNEVRRLKGLFRFAIYFPAIVPGIAAAILWKLMYHPTAGLLNTLRGVMGMDPSLFIQSKDLVIPCIIIMMTWKGFGSTAILYLASLQGVNQELYEASMIDGAGILRKFWNITLPQISGMFSLMFVMQVIGVFQVMYEPLSMTDGGPNNASMSLMLTSYFYGFRFYQAGRAAAVGVVTFVILLSLTFVYFRLQRSNDT